MEKRKKIIAISGSTRKSSVNHRLIKAITELTKEIFEVGLYNGLVNLPQFNPDEDNDNVSKEVLHFRNLLHESDGVIICTPEYAHGVPGSLKNAIDWTVGSADFSQKPTMLITASTDGKNGHQSLLETLRVIEAKNILNLQILIPFAATKINADNIITDHKTLSEIEKLLSDFEQTLHENVVHPG